MCPGSSRFTLNKSARLHNAHHNWKWLSFSLASTVPFPCLRVLPHDASRSLAEAHPDYGRSLTSKAKRRSSLDGGLPFWAPAASIPTNHTRRSSLNGGAPSWAPSNRKLDDTSPVARKVSSDTPEGKRLSLGGGMPTWASAPSPAKPSSADESCRRLSLGGGMPPWAPTANEDLSSQTVDRRKESTGYRDIIGVPDWLKAAAGAAQPQARMQEGLSVSHVLRECV